MNPLSYNQPLGNVDDETNSPVTPGSDVLLDDEMNLAGNKLPLAAKNEDAKAQIKNIAPTITKSTNYTEDSAVIERESTSDFNSRQASEAEVESSSPLHQKSKNTNSECQKFPCCLKRHWSLYLKEIKKRYQELVTSVSLLESNL